MKYIALLLLLLSTLHTKETDFSIIINKPFNDALFDVTQDYDRSISAVGFSNNFVASTKQQNQKYTNAFDYLNSVADAYGAQMHLVKVDSNNGNILHSKAAKLSRFNKAVALVKTPTDGYFVGGYTLDGELIVAKLSANADLVNFHIFGTKNYSRMNNLILLADGGVLAIGSSVTSRSQTDNLFETGLGLNDIYLTRFSKNGVQLWSRKYGTVYDDRGIDAVEARDGSIIVVATTYYDNNRNITLMRTNQNGDKIWLKHYKSDKESIPHKLIRLKDSNFILSLSHKDEMRKEQIRVIKFDLQKNILIDKYINTTYSSVLNDIKEFSNSKLIAVGEVRDSFNTDGLVMLFDNELNMLSQEHYGDENYDTFKALHILNNSQVAAAGINTSEFSQESNMWIVKLNRDGTLAKKSTLKTETTLLSKNLFNELKALLKQEIEAQQLTVNSDLTIDLIDKNLYFRVGEYALNNKQKIFLQKFSTKLITFLYNHKEEIEALEVNGHTSSEWGSSNFTQKYLKNEKLSLNRAYSIIAFIFSKQNRETKSFLADILKGSGVSFSKKVIFENRENRKKSRRASFKILLK